MKRSLKTSMSKLLECIPNFCEGTNKETINKITAAVFSIAGIKVLDVHSDVDHNRSVITFVGEPEAVKKAAFRLTETVRDLIDVRSHHGVHPFIGAVDVIPMVPLQNTTMEDAIATSKELGREIWEKLQIPVYFYGESAELPYRKNLANIRRGGYFRLKNEIHLPERTPDIGNNELHPTCGAVAIGARALLIAFNINLDSNDLETAKIIAKNVRETHGGLPGVKALGVYLKSRDLVQVTMNITDHKETSLKEVFDAVKVKADELGTDILESELIGLIPQEAYFPDMETYLKIADFSPKKVLEKSL
ncbi:MAG: glutamate formimidoyltransferase [Candidatus Saganbacteria bacterium]|nr:glutamate formimidoyltransferase [Candidatus Saganbacteria bacterium]